MITDEHPRYIHESLLKTFKGEDFHQYPDLSQPYKILSQYLNVDEEQLLITRGVEGAIKQVYETLNLEKKSVGVIASTYAMYSVYSSAYDVNHIPIKGTAPDYKLSVKYVKEFVPKIDVLFLINPLPHQSNCFTDGELKEIIDFCKDNDTLVFLDEVYAGWERQSYLPHLDDHDNLIISSSFSKTGFPSIKTGWLVTNKELKKELESTRSSYEIDYFSCKTLEFIIDNRDYFKTLKRRLLETKKRWLDKLSAISNFKVYDSALYTLRIYSKDEELIKRLYDSLYDRKIVVHIEDGVNLTFSVCMDKKIEDAFFEVVSK